MSEMDREVPEEMIRGAEVGVLSRRHPELVDVLAEAAAQYAAFFSHLGPDWYLEGAKVGMRVSDRKRVEAAELEGARGHQRDEAILNVIRERRI